MKKYGGSGVYPREKEPRYPLYRRLCEPEGRSRRYGEKNLLNFYTYQIARRQIPEDLNLGSLMHLHENLKFRKKTFGAK
jgi:hypothetical protein